MKILLSVTECRGIFNCLNQYVCILEVYLETHLSSKYSLNTEWSIIIIFTHFMTQSIFYFSQNYYKVSVIYMHMKKSMTLKEKNQIHLQFWYFSVALSYQNVVIWHWDYNIHLWTFLDITNLFWKMEKKIFPSQKNFSVPFVFFPLSKTMNSFVIAIPVMSDY